MLHMKKYRNFLLLKVIYISQSKGVFVFVSVVSMFSGEIGERNAGNLVVNFW